MIAKSNENFTHRLFSIILRLPFIFGLLSNICHNYTYFTDGVYAMSKCVYSLKYLLRYLFQILKIQRNRSCSDKSIEKRHTMWLRGYEGETHSGTRGRVGERRHKGEHQVTEDGKLEQRLNNKNICAIYLLYT